MTIQLYPIHHIIFFASVMHANNASIYNLTNLTQQTLPPPPSLPLRHIQIGRTRACRPTRLMSSLPHSFAPIKKSRPSTCPPRILLPSMPARAGHIRLSETRDQLLAAEISGRVYRRVLSRCYHR